ncbi:MAG TPA: hypothetical protein PKA55_16750 [Rhodoblastus sp.]|nr:hypothetical protein [Rhodoblastus sp.]
MTPLKTLSTGLAVAALGAGLAASTPAAANPGAVIAAVVGGVAVGAMVAGAANAANQPYGGPYGYYPAQPAYQPAPVYTPTPAYDVAPVSQPGYDEDEVDYAPRCRVVQRPVYDDWGRFVGYRAGRRCR